jgi:Glycosyltransferase family 25 (LPS biosynthesis protein)
MWGQWGTDQRGADPSAPPFEIPLQGLGVFACRRDAWLGFNPRFRGFGGEEGYIHEKVRQSGAATLCLPFLRWIHRFGRPGGVPYSLRRQDGIRNFLIGFQELGLDPAPAIRHFEELIGVDAAREIVDTVQNEIQGPFHFFEAIYCINLDGQEQRWEHAMEEFRKLGIAEAVQRFPAVETPPNHHIGCALSHRAILAEARRRGLRNVLVFEDDVVFAPDAVEILRQNVAELQRLEGMNPWQILYLGGWPHGRQFEKAPGCRHLELAWVTCTHAIAYSNAVYDRILADVPDNPTEAALWCKEHVAIDQYYFWKFGGSALIASPVIATQMNLLQYETRSFEACRPI